MTRTKAKLIILPIVTDWHRIKPADYWLVQESRSEKLGRLFKRTVSRLIASKRVQRDGYIQPLTPWPRR